MRAKEDESKRLNKPIVKIPKWIYVQWAMNENFHKNLSFFHVSMLLQHFSKRDPVFGLPLIGPAFVLLSHAGFWA